MVSASAVRRFDRLLERSAHASTPMAEAQTALDGARAVLRGHPDIARGTERVKAAATLLAIREAREDHSALAENMAKLGEAAAAAGRVVRDVFTIERDPTTGVYRRKYGR